MAGVIASHGLIFLSGLGIGLGIGLVFLRRRRRQFAIDLQRVEISREDKVERFQAAVQRIKEREAKIGELRKEIYHKDQIIRELTNRLAVHHRNGGDQSQARVEPTIKHY